VYVAWHQGTITVPDAFFGFYNYSDILTASAPPSTSPSATSVLTFGATPVRVNNNKEPVATTGPLAGRGTDQFNPDIAVDKAGTIAICFYDRRLDNNNLFTDRECGRSANQGKTWINSRKSTQSFLPIVGQDNLFFTRFFGGYDTVSADGSGASVGFVSAYVSGRAGNYNILSSKP
jgi:hypothetical protein